MYKRSETPLQKRARINYISNVILIGSALAIIYVTAHSSIMFSWSLDQIPSPLLIRSGSCSVKLLHHQGQGAIDAAKFVWQPYHSSYLSCDSPPFNNPVLYTVLLPHLPTSRPCSVTGVPIRRQHFASHSLQPPRLRHCNTDAVKIGRLQIITHRWLCFDAHRERSLHTPRPPHDNGATVKFKIIQAVSSGLVLNTLLPTFKEQLSGASRRRRRQHKCLGALSAASGTLPSLAPSSTVAFPI